MKTLILVLALLFPAAAFAQPAPQMTPAQAAVNIDDQVHALARFADQQANVVQQLNAQLTATGKERDDLKKQVQDLTAQSAALTKERDDLKKKVQDLINAATSGAVAPPASLPPPTQPANPPAPATK